jgi:hypothetical protein
MSNPTDFEIVPIEHAPLEATLAVLNETFGQGHSKEWFAWKHLDNPFGASLGWAAIGAKGVLGVRLFMRWDLQVGCRVVHAVRPVDTATIPEARGHGVFRALTEYAVAAIVANSKIGLIFNTPNVQSRPGYARMGWTILPPIAHGVRPVLPISSADIVQDDLVFEAFESAGSSDERWATRLNTGYMHWRTDQRSGIDYSLARLRQSEWPNGVIYRIVQRRGIRLMIVNDLIGTTDECNLLMRSVARREKALVFLAATGPGAKALTHGRHWRHGSSVLAVRPLHAWTPDPTQLRSWALTLGDLEQII